MKQLFFIIITSIIIISSCSKDEKSAREILTNGKWYYRSLSISKIRNSDIKTQTLEDCAKDDCIVYSTDWTFEKQLGFKMCDSTETDIDGKWNLKDDNKTLFSIDQTGSLAGLPLHYNISSISDNDINLALNDTFYTQEGMIIYKGAIELYKK
jgi:hypothetical protein